MDLAMYGLRTNKPLILCSGGMKAGKMEGLMSNERFLRVGESIVWYVL